MFGMFKTTLGGKNMWVHDPEDFSEDNPVCMTYILNNVAENFVFAKTRLRVYKDSERWKKLKYIIPIFLRQKQNGYTEFVRCGCFSKNVFNTKDLARSADIIRHDSSRPTLPTDWNSKFRCNLPFLNSTPFTFSSTILANVSAGVQVSTSHFVSTVGKNCLNDGKTLFHTFQTFTLVSLK